jgi:hypothetical protein
MDLGACVQHMRSHRTGDIILNGGTGITRARVSLCHEGAGMGEQRATAGSGKRWRWAMRGSDGNGRSRPEP